MHSVDWFVQLLLLLRWVVLTLGSRHRESFLSSRQAPRSRRTCFASLSVLRLRSKALCFPGSPYCMPTEAGQEPFLEQELWSPSGRILTVMMHPGRVKTGLKARDEKGPILSVGDDVALALDGIPIKRWSIGPADEIGPVASAWRVSAVRVDSTQPLVVALDGPIDGRDGDYLAIADVRGRRVAGRAQLTDGEGTWTFTPSAPWRPGAYKLVARGTLEDPAGNRLGSHFETSIHSPPGPPADAVVPFAVGSSPRRATHQ